jgi:hypothetical protein
VRNSECECSFTGAWGTYEEQRASRELAGLDKFDDHPTGLRGHAGKREWLKEDRERDVYLTRIVLPYKTGTVCGC